MKRKMISIITAFAMAFGMCVFLPNIEVEATELRNYNFSTNYSITGNGATDIVNVARAQVGRNGGSFGYTEEWCADFVSDCAIKAGQSNAIPAAGYCPTLQTNIKNAGGDYVSLSEVRAGDILFYGSGGSAHVEIIYANNGGVLSTIGGNCGNSNNSLSLVKDHKNQNGQPSVYKAMRPNYKGGKLILPGTVDSSWAVPATVKASNKCNTYDQYGNTESGRWIDAGDSCYIDAVYTNGFVHVEYPAGNTRRWTYAKRENFPLSKKETPVNLGNDFSALILNRDYWKPIMVQTDGAIKLGTENQTNMRQEIWHFLRNNDGSYNIVSYYNNKSLDAKDNKNETNLYTYDTLHNDYQRWFIYANGDGFRFRPAISSDKCMDLYGNVSDDGTKIVMYARNETGAQKWSIWKFDFVGSSTLSCNKSTAYSGTKFTWTKANHADKYTLKIWKNKLWEGNSIYEKSTTDTSMTVSLPEGKYEAYIDASNNYSYLKGNTLSFTVGACTHKWSDWTITKNAKCASINGSKERTCQWCGKKETQTVTVSNHKWDKSTGKCTECGVLGPYPRVSLDKSSYTVGEKVTFKFASNNCNKYTFAVNDMNKKRIYTIDATGDHYTLTFDKAGKYYCWISATNSVGWSDSLTLNFEITEKKKGYDPNHKPIPSEIKKLQQFLSKTEKPAADENTVEMFDANGDGKINIIDVLILKRQAVKE